MAFFKTHIPDLLVYQPKVFRDQRGYFFESYNYNTFESIGCQIAFVQDNQTRSTRGVLRGLHYQHEPFAQAKLIRVLNGEILDVAVDIRKGSPTFGQYYSTTLSAENMKQILVPRGFAHGFVVLSDLAEVFYKCDNYYSKEHEGGIIYNDPTLKIDWRIDPNQVQLSEKDRHLPTFENAANHFVYKPKL